ncbi:MAG: uroporphyrinogen decarboxylase family protein [bacterium]
MTKTKIDKVLKQGDGVYSMVSRNKMDMSTRKLRDTYSRKPNAPFFQREFGFYCLGKWKEQGLADDANLDEIFGFDSGGKHNLGQLGWCEAPFCPMFEDKLVENRGEHEVIQDNAGRHVLFFKGHRNGFMPTYLDHPVKDRRSWEKKCKWRLNPNTSERYTDFEKRITKAGKVASHGTIITQNMIGGYMYLRSLIGPEGLLYMFYDDPKLIHDCMRTWFKLADAVIAKHQQYLTIDELFLAEDICYNHGSLIAPDMIREFIFPYYQQLISNIKSRQLDKGRHLYIQIDTDGLATPIIPVYREIGMDIMSPFEVASGCNVVEIGKQYPELVIFGGIDKRILAQGKKQIDKHLDCILPAMHKRGGYIPTCDHGVPEEVSLENYKHYRKRCMEYSEEI